MTSCNSSTDTTVKIDSVVKAAKDSLSAVVDTAVRKTDSTIKAVADSAKSQIKAAMDSVKKDHEEVGKRFTSCRKGSVLRGLFAYKKNSDQPVVLTRFK